MKYFKLELVPKSIQSVFKYIYVEAESLAIVKEMYIDKVMFYQEITKKEYDKNKNEIS